MTVGCRLLDGARVWGAVDVRPGRFGITHYRLVVYPPGLSRSQRRRVRVARGWPLWGLMLWLLCEIWLSNNVSPWAALGAATLVTAAAGGVALVFAGDERARVLCLCTTTMIGFDDPAARATYKRIATLSATLVEADARLARGEISVVDHELIWWQVYGRLESATTTPSSLEA
jgi:hypothetical protein